jgi:hypothetical protein
VCPVIATTGEEPRAVSVPVDKGAVSIELDLVKPIETARWLASKAGKAWLDEGGAGDRNATGTQHVCRLREGPSESIKGIMRLCARRAWPVPGMVHLFACSVGLFGVRETGSGLPAFTLWPEMPMSMET